MFNHTTLIGRTTADVEVRETSSNHNVASFTLAVNRKFKNANGERKTDFFNCIAWNKTAELIQEYTSKGDQVALSGYLQTRNYENQQGQRVYVTELVVEDFNVMGARKQNVEPVADESLAEPFPGQEIDISDDDLPF